PVTGQTNGGHSLLRQAFLPAPEIITWLTGSYQPPAGLEDAVRLSAADDLLLSAGLLPETGLDVDLIRDTRPVVILHGQDDLQQNETARYLSASLNRPLLTVDIARVKEALIADGALADYVLRDAMLNGAMPHFLNWEALSTEAGLQQALFERINHLDEPVILQSKTVWQINRNGSRQIKPALWVKCDLPNTSQRLQLWKSFLSSEAGLADPELEILAGQFTLTSSQIRNAVYTARDAALQENRPISTADLYAAARQHSSHHLESLAVKIPPRYGWNDIVLPEDEMSTLHEIAETVRWRSVVLEEWGVGQRLMPNAGISALFAGPSGTGKTLAAQVIAAELKMDLYKIDLSTVVSKYIGETEKNLE
ncbi:MAG: ATP-binding protein, partial [Anaerolineaceae bacterium]